MAAKSKPTSTRAGKKTVRKMLPKRMHRTKTAGKKTGRFAKRTPKYLYEVQEKRAGDNYYTTFDWISGKEKADTLFERYKFGQDNKMRLVKWDGKTREVIDEYDGEAKRRKDGR